MSDLTRFYNLIGYWVPEGIVDFMIDICTDPESEKRCELSHICDVFAILMTNEDFDAYITLIRYCATLFNELNCDYCQAKKYADVEVCDWITTASKMSMLAIRHDENLGEWYARADKSKMVDDPKFDSIEESVHQTTEHLYDFYEVETHKPYKLCGLIPSEKYIESLLVECRKTPDFDEEYVDNAGKSHTFKNFLLKEQFGLVDDL